MTEENKHRIANLKAILRATRKDVRRLRLAGREASNTLRELFQKVKEDAANGHRYYTEIGLVSIDRERALNAVKANQLEVSKLRLELRDLLQK